MIKYIDVTGKTEDEAIANALAQLGLEREDISVEVLERAKAGFLGIGGSPAKIRASYEAAECVKHSAKQEKPAVKAEKPTVKAEKSAAVTNPASGEKQKNAEKFLSGLFERMGISAEMSFTDGEDGSINIELSGADMGALIGRRGETLDAIQHLANYAVNRGESGRTRINIDAENYRAKRTDSLRRLAEKVAGKVVKYRRNVTLEPMNAYERHVIHSALQSYDGVTTFSTGNEPNRRVVVAYERGGRPESSDRPRRQASGSQRPRADRTERENRQPPQEVQTPTQSIESKYPSREWN